VKNIKMKMGQCILALQLFVALVLPSSTVNFTRQLRALYNVNAHFAHYITIMAMRIING
jgi:hypothetical protein